MFFPPQGYTRMIYVNPDDFLGSPRIFTPERNRDAWQSCKDLVEKMLACAERPYNYYLVCGVQGAGKTRWIRDNPATFIEPALVFDAAHARARDRAPAIAHARRFSCHTTAIWISCPLELALTRNRERPHDQVVPDDVVPPTTPSTLHSGVPFPEPVSANC